METKKEEKWFKILTSSRNYPLKNEEITEIWSPVRAELTEEEQLCLMEDLVQKDDVFKWLHLISNLLPSLFSENKEFMKLVEIVVEKIKNDMAQGIFIRSLIDTGEKNADSVIRIYPKLTEDVNELTIEFTGLILGGAAKNKFSETLEIINNGLKSSSIAVIIASLKALRVATESEIFVFPKEIYGILDEIWKIQEPSLKTEIIGAYIDFDRYDAERAESRLLKISSGGDSAERYTITRRLWFAKLVNLDKEIEILRECAKDKNPQVQANLFQVFGQKGKLVFGRKFRDHKEYVKVWWLSL